MFNKLKKNNPDLSLFRVTDSEFVEYGAVLNLDTTEMVSTAKSLSVPENGTAYTASDPELEKGELFQFLQNEVFGQLPVQVGYCRGHNSRMNAMEWHKCSEINIAVTPLIILLGHLADVKNGTFDAKSVKGFYLEAGQSVEIFATSLHYCPCQADPDGFGCIVVLPKETNLKLDNPVTDPLLRAKNKWILAHKDNTGLIGKGVVGGIYGENYTVIDN